MEYGCCFVPFAYMDRLSKYVLFHHFNLSTDDYFKYICQLVQQVTCRDFFVVGLILVPGIRWIGNRRLLSPRKYQGWKRQGIIYDVES